MDRGVPVKAAVKSRVVDNMRTLVLRTSYNVAGFVWIGRLNTLYRQTRQTVCLSKIELNFGNVVGGGGGCL